MMASTTFKTFLAACFLLSATVMFSQGLVEADLTTNAVLVKKWNELQAKGGYKAASITDTLSLGTLGILDDFSYDSPYPDTALWLDSSVYINRGYPYAPPTIGVATFDGLKANGYPYNFAFSATSSAVADYLTSKPIDLEYTPTPTDSVYLSFFYQPQGRGNAPEAGDSLIVQFKAPGAASAWKNVWAKKGSSLTLSDTLKWDYAMIPVADSAFLQKGFQFRFKNYATLSGNVDHWHVDYVYLNNGRTRADTAVMDMSFVYEPTSLLKNYQAMPWKQYRKSELRSEVKNVIRNHFNGAVKAILYDHSIRNETSSTLLGTHGPAGVNLRPFDSTHIYTDCDIALGCIDLVDVDTSVFPASLTGPQEFTISHYFNTVDSATQNDTSVFHLRLKNYFAYDDGTAETAFGLSTLDGLLAEKFVLNEADTLRYIDIYFNPIVTNANLYTFDLKVWADGGGAPGTILYTSDTAQSPEYTNEGVNDFRRYELHVPVYLAAGTFYVGFEQNTNQFLNIGVDKNNNTQNNIYYNVTGGWNNSPIAGSLMMRPVFGFESITGIADHKTETTRFTIWPNPASEVLYVRTSSKSQGELSYQVFDMFGRMLKQGVVAQSSGIDISSLSGGAYFIRIGDGQTFSSHKFIKAN